MKKCANIIEHTLKVVNDTKKIDFYNISSICNKCDANAADIVFLIDSSSSIGDYSFYYDMLPFVKNVTAKLDVSQDKVHVGVV
jgi:hypothetical protein